MRHASGHHYRTVRSLWTWLWGRYHVPQNVFLVSYIFITGFFFFQGNSCSTLLYVLPSFSYSSNSLHCSAHHFCHAASVALCGWLFRALYFFQPSSLFRVLLRYVECRRGLEMRNSSVFPSDSVRLSNS